MTALEPAAVVGVAATASFACLLLRKGSPAFSFLVSLGGGVLLGCLSLPLFGDLATFFSELQKFGSLSESLLTIFTKAFGMALLTRLGASLAADCGSSFLEGVVLWVGRLGICVVALPLFSQFLSLVADILEGAA